MFERDRDINRFQSYHYSALIVINERNYSHNDGTICLCRWEKDVGIVVEAAVRGAGGVTAARARLHAALLALHDPPAMHRMPALPYCGPGVRPGDVTMMPKTSEMSLLVSVVLSLFSNRTGL